MSEFSALLEIENRLLGFEDERSIADAATLWERASKPRDLANLIAFLEKVIKACQRQGTYYAPVLLKRKREMQRGAWRPKKPGAHAQCTAKPYDPTCGGKIPREWIERAEKQWAARQETK